VSAILNFASWVKADWFSLLLNDCISTRMVHLVYFHHSRNKKQTFACDGPACMYIFPAFFAIGSTRYCDVTFSIRHKDHMTRLESATLASCVLPFLGGGHLFLMLFRLFHVCFMCSCILQIFWVCFCLSFPFYRILRVFTGLTISYDSCEFCVVSLDYEERRPGSR